MKQPAHRQISYTARALAAGKRGKKGSTSTGMSVQPYGEIGPAPKTCRWPLWGNDDAPTHAYCGEAVVRPGVPYCASHMARAWHGKPISTGPLPYLPGPGRMNGI